MRGAHVPAAWPFSVRYNGSVDSSEEWELNVASRLASRAPRLRNAAEGCVSTETILETNLPLLELPRVEELRPPHARALRQQLAARVPLAGLRVGCRMLLEFLRDVRVRLF